nr:MAG TPA: PhnA Zinc-Ribbon [Caudoviricetes sp.]
MLDATARELWRCLDGIDALDWRKDKRNEDLKATLIACAGHPRLATFADAGLYMHVINDLARKVDTVLDPPEQRREIGTCELCETMLTAGAADQWVTCPVCGREQRAQTVKLRRLKTLCWDDSERGSAADISKAFAVSGLKVSRKTITTWEQRGKLPRHADGYAYCDVYRLLIGPDLTKSVR